jgi:hypothetical protein
MIRRHGRATIAAALATSCLVGTLGISGCDSGTPAPPQGPSPGIKISRHFRTYTVGESCTPQSNEAYMDVAALRCVDRHLIAMTATGP